MSNNEFVPKFDDFVTEQELKKHLTTQQMETWESDKPFWAKKASGWYNALCWQFAERGYPLSCLGGYFWPYCKIRLESVLVKKFELDFGLE